jgi:hypothetical protein
LRGYDHDFNSYQLVDYQADGGCGQGATIPATEIAAVS